MIHFPIVKPTTFDLYELYPVPYHNFCIIPPHPFLALNDFEYYYQTHGCSNFENLFICTDPSITPSDNCIIPLIRKGKSNDCTATKALLTTTLFQQISKDDVLIIPYGKEVLLFYNCAQKTTYVKIEQPSLITLQTDCIISLDGQKIYSKINKLNGKPFILPTMKNQSLYGLNKTKIQTIKLENINMVNLHKAVKDLEEIPADAISFEENYLYTTHYLWIFLFLIGLILTTLALCMYLRRRKNNTTHNDPNGINLKIAVGNQPQSSDLGREELHNSSVI